MTSALSRPSPGGGSAPWPGNYIIVLFGATGDLARRKLLPGLFHLAEAGLMPDRYQIIDSSRRSLTGEQFRELARQAAAEFGASQPTSDKWQDFGRRLWFASAEPGRTGSLAEAIAAAERQSRGRRPTGPGASGVSRQPGSRSAGGQVGHRAGGKRLAPRRAGDGGHQRPGRSRADRRAPPIRCH